MELDLDLSLSPHSNFSKLGFEFDLNKHCTASCLDTKKSRLFSLNGQPNEEDEEEEDPFKSDSSIVYDEEETSEVVGWPPIKSCMTKYHNYLHQHQSRNHPYHHHGMVLNNNISNPMATIERVGSPSPSSSTSTTSSRSSLYVKVKMEGVAIARKVDIMLFNSYNSLTNSLITMFSQYEGCDKEDTNYTFTFQGKDGDWLLPGDVPWKIFAESVRRISISRDRPCAYTRLLF